MRTPEEISAQIEARVAEMEEEYKTLDLKPPCVTCRWNGLQHGSKIHEHHCHNPLIIGLENHEHTTVDWQQHKGWYPANRNWPRSYLCGPEKALWQAVPSIPTPLGLLERLGHWLCDLFGID